MHAMGGYMQKVLWRKLTTWRINIVFSLLNLFTNLMRLRCRAATYCIAGECTREAHLNLASCTSCGDADGSRLAPPLRRGWTAWVNCGGAHLPVILPRRRKSSSLSCSCKAFAGSGVPARTRHDGRGGVWAAKWRHPPHAPPTFPALTAAVERSWTPLAPITPLPVREPGRQPAEFAPHEASCRRRRAEQGARAVGHCANWVGGGRGAFGTFSSSWEGAVVVGMGIAAGCAVVEWGGNVGGPTCVSCGLLALPCEPPPSPPPYDVVATAVFGWGGFLPVAGPSAVGVGSSAVGCLISLSFLRLTAQELVSRLFPPGQPPVLVRGVDRALTRWPRRGPTER